MVKPGALGLMVLCLGRLRLDRPPAGFALNGPSELITCVLVAPLCLPTEPKDEVEVSDDGECRPPILGWAQEVGW